MYWFNASISKRKTSLLITFCKCSCKIYIFTHFRTFVYLKWKIYKPDFAQIMQILAVVSDSYFCLSVCPFVYHIVFIEVATAIIEALQCKTLFFHPMCDSFNFYLCMILIVVVCMIFFFFIWHIAGMNLGIWLAMTLLSDFRVELKRVCLLRQVFWFLKFI